MYCVLVVCIVFCTYGPPYYCPEEDLISSFRFGSKPVIKPVSNLKLRIIIQVFGCRLHKEYAQVLQSLSRFSVPCREEIREDFARRVLLPKSRHINMFRLLTTFTANADGLNACKNAYILVGAIFL